MTTRSAPSMDLAKRARRQNRSKVRLRLLPPACDPYFSDNDTHFKRGRALPDPNILGNVIAFGSGDKMGPLTDHDFNVGVLIPALLAHGLCP